ncbi:MAG: regulator of cell morphogenesis and NO signaling [Myxococcota bacterium]
MSDVDWTVAPLDDLMAHIVETYHVPHLSDVALARQELAPLTAAFPDDRSSLGGLDITLRQLEFLLRHHQTKEETRLFPLIARGDFGAASASAAVMEQEHAQLSGMLDRLAEVTDGFCPPAHADATWSGLFDRLDRFHAQAIEHTELEDTVLFARVRALAADPG